MNRTRVWTICRLDLRQNVRRPLFWIWLLLIFFAVAVLASGAIRIDSGESIAGGLQAHITSQFANAYEMSLFVAMIYPLFMAVAAGMGVIRDGELRIEPVLQATPLTASEYIWSKFLAAMLTALMVLAVHLGMSIFFKQTWALQGNPELVGTFLPANYIVPAMVFALPLIVFVAGVSFLVGERTRNAVLVNMVPLILLLASVFFLWTWSPSWLDPDWNRLLMLIEPTGYRWLNETCLRVDQGAEYYNTASIPFDTPFILSRLALVAIGLLAVGWSSRRFRQTLRGQRVSSTIVERALAGNAKDIVRPASVNAPLASLGMSTRPRGMMRSMLEIARVELLELRKHPALWILIFLVVLNAVFDAIYSIGAFDTPLLLTPGSSAVGSLVELTFTLCLMVVFFTVETMRRDHVTRFSSISHATPIRTWALIGGKILATSAVGFATLLVVSATCCMLMLRQGTVPIDVKPYLIVYGLLIGPVILFTASFVALMYSLTGSRMTTYAIFIVLMIVTGILFALQKMSWVWNWSLSGALHWSDMAVFDKDLTALTLNRVLMFSMAILMLAVTVRVFPRRVFDHLHIQLRLRPGALLRTALRLSPLILLPIVLGFTLHRGIKAGPQGTRHERWEKNYWRRNVETWADALNPDITFADVELVLEPQRRWLHANGTYELANGHEEPLSKIALTGGYHWHNVAWTLNGELATPENRQGLYIFTLPQPLAPESRCVIGFDFEGVLLDGFTKNGNAASEFILPSGIVLTSFTSNFVPQVGFQDGIGIDEDNVSDARDYPDDFYEGRTAPVFGADLPHPARLRITAPEAYTINSVGTLTDSVLADGLRTVTWETDHPVRFFNVVGGLWDVRRGEGTAIFHHPDHTYNIDEMIQTLDAAKHWYAEWFHPFPWEELKISEFPAQAGYAQGLPTNITFSESIGFLTKSNPHVSAAFRVTAHETAHQWWGNILMPGHGPGGEILSEGAAHFSTILLFGQVKGLQHRMEFCRRLESNYCNRRVIDAERPLVKIDGMREGDMTIGYDKGGWVFWMMLNHMGRERALEGIRSFIDYYAMNRDHPVLQDFVTHLRPFAPDPVAYDEFVEQWFFEVVLPEFRLHDVRRTERTDGTWEVTARIENRGSGRMPVEIATMRGIRFYTNGTINEDYRDFRQTIMLRDGEDGLITIQCPFEPDRLVIDPDVVILQLNRRLAVHMF